MLAAIVYSLLAIQFKIYPIIYLPSIYLNLIGFDKKQYPLYGHVISKMFLKKCLYNLRGLIFITVIFIF